MIVNSIAQRVRALQSGYKPLVPRTTNNLTTLAMEEFKQDKIRVSTIETEPTESEEEAKKTE